MLLYFNYTNKRDNVKIVAIIIKIPIQMSSRDRKRKGRFLQN